MSSIHWVSYLSNSLLIYAFFIFFALLWLFALILHCLCYFNRSLYTDVVLFSFSFFSKTLASSLAKRACENERGARERKMNFLFSSSPTPTPLRWRSINPLRFQFITRARLTLKGKYRVCEQAISIAKSTKLRVGHGLAQVLNTSAF